MREPSLAYYRHLSTFTEGNVVGKKYRKAVVGVFVNTSNEVLVLERSDIPGSWQLPQGGVDEGESLEDAVKREMLEELGTHSFQVIEQASHVIRYRFPDFIAETPIGKKYAGQDLTWFLIKFTGGAEPDLEAAEDKEFASYKWSRWQDACEGVVDWKKDAYYDGFESLGFK
jgi:putative (di)nucleoside polyphosphate hydrolase